MKVVRNIQKWYGYTGLHRAFPIGVLNGEKRKLFILEKNTVTGVTFDVSICFYSRNKVTPKYTSMFVQV